MTIVDGINNLRDRVANALATRPIPEFTQLALQNPLHTRTEVDETLAAVSIQIGQIVDFHARQRAIDASKDIDHDTVMRRYMETPIGQQTLLMILEANPQIIDNRITEVVNKRVETIVIERMKAAKPTHSVRVKERNHFFFARMFSWLGMLIGLVFGAVMGLIANFYLDAGSVTMTEGGKQYVGADIIDSLPGQIGIVVLLALAFGALGAALFNRRKDDANN